MSFGKAKGCSLHVFVTKLAVFCGRCSLGDQLPWKAETNRDAPGEAEIKLDCDLVLQRKYLKFEKESI
jgi:hypothetical protein